MTLEYHPYAELFPLIEGEQFEKFAADIRDNGLRDKIVLLGGRILDGRNRYRACVHHQLPAADGDAAYFRDFDPATDGEPLAWVLSKNLARRHLTEGQRAWAAERLATMRQGERTDLEPSATVPKVSQDQAAKMLQVSARLVRAAKVVREKGIADLADLVARGQLLITHAERAAKLDQESQARVVALAGDGKGNAVRTAIKQGQRQIREQILGAKQQALPDKRYGIILADPEWEFTVFSTVTGLDRSPANHYPTSSEKEIAARDIHQISAPDAMLALWVTDLARGIRIMEAWGFHFKSYFVWIKDIVQVELTDAMRVAGLSDRTFRVVGPAGTGYWRRDRCELLLIGTRGNFVAPAMGTQPESTWFDARPKVDGGERGRHSAKPETAHAWIEANWPSLPKIELNARQARPGWDVWGYEAPQPDGAPPAQDLYSRAVDLVRTENSASTSFVQRKLAIGYNRAASLMERMEQEGIISAPDHKGVRTVIAADGCAPADATESEKQIDLSTDQVDPARAQQILQKHEKQAFDPVRDMPAFLRRNPARDSA